ncbi:MAG: signal peptidase I [Angelakisella sp.]
MSCEELCDSQTTQTDQLSAAERFSLKRSILGMVASVVLAILLFFAVTTFFRPTLTQGHSMAPTLADGDCAIAAVFDYHPAHGDIVVIHDSHQQGKYIVKRIIGLAGDTIHIDFTTGAVTRNGVLLDEPYLPEPTTTPGDLLFPVVVPQGHVFVMGDNRNHSTDSRTSYTGMIAQENIEGKVIFRFYPLDKIGGIH